MNASDYIARYLHAQGVTHVFELIGGMITHLVDAVHRDGRIELVSVRHEQAAAFAADAAGRVTGVPGVAMATSGPGATNLLTGIGSCFFDSSPAVFITGQVNTHEQRGDRPIRQLGFQETDIVAMAAPITKAAVRVGSVDELPRVLEDAFALALSGRPGPVLIDIPMDVQGARIDVPDPVRVSAAPGPRPSSAAVAAVAADLHSSRRPLILAGAGVRSAGAADALDRLSRQAGIPVVHSLLGVDALPGDHPSRVGLIGSYGNRWANFTIAEADVLVVVGARLDVRQTGADVEAFGAGRRVVHVDIDPGEINNRVLGCVAIESDARAFLDDLGAALLPKAGPDRYAAWRRRIAELREEWPDVAELAGGEGINPNVLMHELSAASRASWGYVVDVGQHQQWAAQSLQLEAGQRFITSGGMGAMGFALPAAIGVAHVAPGRPVVVVAGDGAFQLNLQELQTAAHASLPLKLVILNNQTHGMVRQFQQTHFGERYQSTWWGYSAPSFAAVAAAYGIGSTAVSTTGELKDGLAELWRDPAQPFLLEVAIDPLANVYPKLAYGFPMTEMEPFAEQVAMEGT